MIKFNQNKMNKYKIYNKKFFNSGTTKFNNKKNK